MFTRFSRFQKNNPRLVKGILAVWLIVLFSGIAYIFYQHEWKYTLPTAVPMHYNPAKTGDLVKLNNDFPVKDRKPLFIHFFNPDCPCSRFNMPHFKSLVKKYNEQIDFAIVVMNQKYTSEEIREKYAVEIPVSFNKTIADSCGVYSTPQAVLLDADRKLYYRGNYNKSRYCTDKKSNYAEMAIDSFLANNTEPEFSNLAIKAYGCELPECTK